MPAEKLRKKPQKSAPFSKRIFNHKLILAAGLLLIGLSLGLDIYQKSLPIFIGYQPEDKAIAQQIPGALPRTLFIPDISVNLNIETAQAKGNIWQISETGVSYLLTSANLKEMGNTVIYGHNRKNLLKKLPDLKKGASIYLTDDAGKIYKFVVFDILTVRPEDTWILANTDEKLLTIYTCTGFLDSKRLVIKAKPEVS